MGSADGAAAGDLGEAQPGTASAPGGTPQGVMPRPTPGIPVDLVVDAGGADSDLGEVEARRRAAGDVRPLPRPPASAAR